jgi:cytoskeletal protein RodZ
MKTHKKLIITTVLCVACVGILVTCFILSRDRTSEFTPDPLPEGTSSTWEENRSDSGGNGSATDPTDSGTAAEGYPKETQDANGNVDIEFTPPSEDLKPETPEPPKTEADNTNPAAPPTYTPDEVNASAETESQDNNTPAPGSKNSDGAIYDPAFGWIVPGSVNQSTIDSEGDPNKQVGEMGP